VFPRKRALPALDALRKLGQNGALTRTLEEIAHSLIHMSCNRVLRSAQRTQETVIYEFLARLYDSEWARSRGFGDRSKSAARQSEAVS
jgi:thiopeptide-type bacteriocin biosynthesis protein